MGDASPNEDIQLLQVSALKMAALAIVITGPKGTILWANRAFTKLSGYPLEEAVGRNMSILKSGVMPPYFYEGMWSTISSGEVWIDELVNRRKDGSHYVEEMTITPIQDEKGVIHHYIAFKQDISSRRNIVEELRQNLKVQEERYNALERARSETRAVLDATSEAFLLLSMDSKFMWVNRAFERFFAVIEEDLIGRDLKEMLPHSGRVFDNPSGLLSRLIEASNYEDPSSRENVVQRWPRIRNIEVYSTLVRNDLDEELGILCVFRDVSREREVERMQSEFVALVSHELRTPLTSIEGYVDMLLDGDAGGLNKLQLDFLNVVKRNSDRLTTLVSDLLDVSRIESGSIKLRWETFDIKDLIKDVVGNLRSQFEAKGQRLSVDLRGGGSNVSGDVGRITQVFTNLLTNANKYTPEGGAVRVSSRRGDRRIEISIADTGIGLSSEDQARLFTKFFRSDDPSIRAIGGSGLGLWLSRSLVEMHGGEISFTSEVGKGSTFTVRLPLET
ncbi:PAS domain S-box protein [Candidatus Bathyarchaeota archaeon]|nr:PAS domain S-box protein [Candidatus Bathyarchaeota archaeon]